MVVSIIGAIIGALIAVFGLYYLVKEWKDPESKKIYSIISGTGGGVFVIMLVKLLIEIR